jgi:hypothetical protein
MVLMSLVVCLDCIPISASFGCFSFDLLCFLSLLSVEYSLLMNWIKFLLYSSCLV